MPFDPNLIANAAGTLWRDYHKTILNAINRHKKITLGISIVCILALTYLTYAALSIDIYIYKMENGNEVPIKNATIDLLYSRSATTDQNGLASTFSIFLDKDAMYYDIPHHFFINATTSPSKLRIEMAESISDIQFKLPQRSHIKSPANPIIISADFKNTNGKKCCIFYPNKNISLYLNGQNTNTEYGPNTTASDTLFRKLKEEEEEKLVTGINSAKISISRNGSSYHFDKEYEFEILKRATPNANSANIVKQKDGSFEVHTKSKNPTTITFSNDADPETKHKISFMCTKGSDSSTIDILFFGHTISIQKKYITTSWGKGSAPIELQYPLPAQKPLLFEAAYTPETSDKTANVTVSIKITEKMNLDKMTIDIPRHTPMPNSGELSIGAHNENAQKTEKPCATMWDMKFF